MRLHPIRLFLMGLCLALSACGFHLRAVNEMPADLQSLAIEPDAPWSAFQRELRQQLQASGATITSKPKAIVFIKNESETSTNLAYGANGQVNRVRVELSLDFEVHDDAGKTISGLQHIVVSRDYGVNPNAQLASDDEKNLIVHEMRKEAALQLIRRLMSVKSAPETP